MMCHGIVVADQEAARALVALLQQQRAEAAQMEWERWKRVNGTVAIGLRQTAKDLEYLTNHVDVDGSAQRDMLRYATIVRDSANELDGENWLKSPKAMAEQRKQAQQENGRL